MNTHSSIGFEKQFLIQNFGSKENWIDFNSQLYEHCTNIKIKVNEYNKEKNN